MAKTPRLLDIKGARYQLCVFQVKTRDLHGQPKECYRVDAKEVLALQKIKDETGRDPEFILAYVNERNLIS